MCLIHHFIIISTFILLVYLIYYSIFKKSKLESFSISKSLPQGIPKVIVSTYMDKKKIPQKVYDNVKKFAPNYKFIVFDDKEIIEFLKKNYPPNVLETFYKLKGAHRADLFRYCYLRIFGGVYMDIKTVLIKDLDSVLYPKGQTKSSLYTILSIHKHSIYQGFIAAIPRHFIFEPLITHIINTGRPKYYLNFTYDFYRKLQKYCDQPLRRGRNTCQDGSSCYLYSERCSKDSSLCPDGLDRYKLCCHIYDGDNIVIKTRYPDFPW